MYGTTGAHYTYDSLDNITRTIAPGRAQYDCYDTTTNQLTNVNVNGTCSTGATILGLGYDSAGNLDNGNGMVHTFDYGNRLREVAGKESYRYDVMTQRFQHR